MYTGTTLAILSIDGNALDEKEKLKDLQVDWVFHFLEESEMLLGALYAGP